MDARMMAKWNQRREAINVRGIKQRGRNFWFGVCLVGKQSLMVDGAICCDRIVFWWQGRQKQYSNHVAAVQSFRPRMHWQMFQSKMFWLGCFGSFSSEGCWHRAIPSLNASLFALCCGYLWLWKSLKHIGWVCSELGKDSHIVPSCLSYTYIPYIYLIDFMYFN